jgi:adenosylmethionine-8-amino-7-oxononanoate aminotransferase
MSALHDTFGQHPHIGDIRGRGLFIGLEIVADRDTKVPFDAALGVAKKIKKEAFEAGLICYPMAGTLDGRNGDHVLLAPPFIINDGQIDELTSKLSIAINRTID